MKSYLLILLIACLGMSLSPELVAQNCRPYLPSAPGNLAELTTYNKKGKVSGTITYLTESTEEQAEGTLYQMKMTLKDAGGEVQSESLVQAECRGETYFVDTQTLLDPNVYARYQSMNISFEGTALQFPQDLQAGMSLPDADLVLSIEAPIPVNINVLIKNRTITKEESLTTSAGTFYCYLIEYDSEVKAGLTVTSSVKQWISGEVGIVKQETFNKAGKLTGSMELTRLER